MNAAPKNNLAGLEKELQEERAGALGRLGGTIEKLILELEALERSLPPSGPARDAGLARHEELRLEAEKYVWYLVVTREAIGLKRHDDVYQLYPVPRRLAPRG